MAATARFAKDLRASLRHFVQDSGINFGLLPFVHKPSFQFFELLFKAAKALTELGKALDQSTGLQPEPMRHSRSTGYYRAFS